jgi:peptidoglycan/LPS O-acetylase OafA/YrhL
MKRFKIIDLTRSFCLFCVLALHLSLPGIIHPYGFGWVNYIWYSFACDGSYGVSLFFVISGFLITGVIHQNSEDLFKPDFRDFYFRRICRIFPLLFLVCAIGIILLESAPPSAATAYCVKEPGVYLGFSFWLSIATFSFNWMSILHEKFADRYGLQWDVLWSLAIEEQFYLFYPFFLNRLKNRRNLVFFLVFFIFLGPLSRWAAYQINPKSYLLIFTNSFGAFDQIALGVLLYLAVEKWRKPLGRSKVLPWFLCLGGLGLMAAVFAATNIMWNKRDEILGPSGVAMGLFLFLLGGLNLRIFDSNQLKVFAWPGKLSYGGYLLHSSILYFMWPFLSGLQILQAFFMYALVVTAVSWFSYRCYELPMNRLVYSWLRRVFRGSGNPVNPR